MTVSRRRLFALLAAGGAAACGRPGRSAHTSEPASDHPTSSSSTDRAESSVRTPPAPPPRRAAGPAREVSHGPRDSRAVALTFHGAGDPAIARELFAIFAAHRAKMTVLAVGTWLEAYPALAHEIVAAGHELGNHTYRHLDIDGLPRAAARAEIVRCRDVIARLVGDRGAHFRPSQTRHATSSVLALAGAAGYRVCLSYDVDSLDYTDPGPSTIRANVAAARGGSIVSLHFGHPGTATAMPGVLADLHSRGLHPVTATELLS